jgi:hypothetical protein
MGKMTEKERNPFKEPSEFYRSMVFFGFFVLMGLFVEYTAFTWSEEEILEYINENSGKGEIGLGKLITRFLMMFLGVRAGFIAAISLCFTAILYELYREIAAYLRYKRKCKLFHEGIIKNIYDIYDDHALPSVWQLIKRLFTKKEKTYKSQYPSNRELKKQIKEFERSRRRK